MLATLDARKMAGAIAAAAAATVAGAWAFEWAGYLPCELCLLQRQPYYAAILIGAAAFFSPPRIARLSLIALALLFVGSALFGIYHSGVEWGVWRGPTGCTGAIDKAGSVADFMKQLDTVKVVRCDQPAIRILGLSLAGWNAIISGGLAAAAIAGFKRG